MLLRCALALLGLMPCLLVSYDAHNIMLLLTLNVCVFGKQSDISAMSPPKLPAHHAHIAQPYCAPDDL